MQALDVNHFGATHEFECSSLVLTDQGSLSDEPTARGPWPGIGNTVQEDPVSKGAQLFTAPDHP